MDTIDVTSVLLALLRRLSVWWTYTSNIPCISLVLVLPCVALAVCVALVLAFALPLIQIALHISISPKCLVAMDRLAIFDQKH